MTASEEAVRLPRVKSLSRIRHWIKDHLPNSPWVRVPVGVVLVLGGALGFLPVLGFWMIPAGLLVLAIDFPPARRAARWMYVKIGRLTQRRRRAA